MCYQYRLFGHHGPLGGPVAGHVVEERDRACVAAFTVYHSVSVLLAADLGLKHRDVTPTVVKYQVSIIAL